MNQITEHYPTDVPKLTRIIDPVECKGKLIVDIKANFSDGYTTLFFDDGTQFRRANHLTIRVEHGPERQAKMAWARSLLQ